MIKVDLHTHSTASPDGGLSFLDYQKAIKNGLLNIIAITDHNEIDFALETQKQLGKHIIVGEEIDTSEGEVIGLYLKSRIASKLGLKATIKEIRSQGGLVYIPHPFETKRKGIQSIRLDVIKGAVDIIETYNGRAWVQNFTKQALKYAEDSRIATAASSDSHGRIGWGRTYTELKNDPTKETLLELLRDCSTVYEKPHPISILYPSFNRLRRRVNR